MIESALSAAGVPYQLRGAEQFFERPEVKQAVLALRGSAKGTDGSEHAPSLVRDVLSSLGYSEKESAAAVGRLPEDISVKDGIRQALKGLGKN